MPISIDGKKVYVDTTSILIDKGRFKGYWRVTVHFGDVSDFAISKSEPTARAKAQERLRYRLNGFK